MEIELGPRQTEVGLLPADWDVVPLKQTCKLHNGRAYALREWETAGTPVIRLQNLTGGEDYYYSNLRLPEDKYCEHGDLLFMWSATFGPRIWAGGRAIFHYHIWKVTPRPDVATKEYLYFKLGHITEEKKARAANGGTMLHVTKGSMEATNIALPCVDEQRAIATALGDVDALIAALDKLIAKKRDLKQAAMQQLLSGQARLPGFGGKWAVKQLGDVIEKAVGGGTPSRSVDAYWDGDIPWVTVKDFATFDHRRTQERITVEGLRNSASHLIPKGTLITSTRMALGKAVIYDVDASINQDLKALFPKDSLTTSYLLFWFHFHSETIARMGSGSTVMGIALADLRQIEFLLPSVPEQTAIAAVLSDMDVELAALEARRDKTRALKQGMMQELLTGRIRLLPS